jgi:hypothetical protein
VVHQVLIRRRLERAVKSYNFVDSTISFKYSARAKAVSASFHSLCWRAAGARLSPAEIRVPPAEIEVPPAEIEVWEAEIHLSKAEIGVPPAEFQNCSLRTVLSRVTTTTNNNNNNNTNNNTNNTNNRTNSSTCRQPLPWPNEDDHLP